MAGRIVFLIGGILLFAFGAIFLVNNIIVLRTLDPVPFPDDKIFISNWADKVPLMGEQVFRYGTIVVPCLLIIAGLLGIFRHFLFGAYIGVGLATTSILFLSSVVLGARTLLVPFYENLGLWFRFSAERSSWAYMISIMVLGFCIHIYMTAIEAMTDIKDGDEDYWDAYVITHSITRALFLFVFLPLCYVSTGGTFSDVLATGVPPLVIYFYIVAFIPVFRGIRRGFNDKRSPIRDILLTLACVVAFFMWNLILVMVRDLFVVIHNFIVYFPIGAALFLLFGFAGGPASTADIYKKTHSQKEHERVTAERIKMDRGY